MAIIHSCCFWKSLRKGTYASAIYAVLYFGVCSIIMSISIHDERKYLAGEIQTPTGESFLEKEAISSTTVIFNILLLICASCGVISSILVIIGLKRDQRELLVPWILIMFADLTLECSHFLYLIVLKTLDFEPLTATLFTIDFFIVVLNIYCLLCVISQYQEYKAGRGIDRKESRANNVRYTPPPPSTTTCLNTFRQSKVITSPLMCPHTNFTIIPEETQLNGSIDEENSKSTGIVKIKMPEDTNGNGRVIDDKLPEYSESMMSWKDRQPQHLKQIQKLQQDQNNQTQQNHNVPTTNDNNKKFTFE